MAIRTVGPNSTYPTIAAAIAASSSGDTISLQAGYGNETASVTVNNLIVTGASSSTNVLLQLSSGVTQLTLQGSAPIAVVDEAGNDTITGNSGDNSITVTGGIDNVNGGTGNDRPVVDSTTTTGGLHPAPPPVGRSGVGSRGRVTPGPRDIR